MVAEPNLHEAQQMHAERFAPLPSVKLSGKRWELPYGEEGNLLLFCLIRRRSSMA